MIRNISATLFLCLLMACGASIDPLLQSKLHLYFSKSSGKSYNAGAKFIKPMPYAVGQYVVHGMTNGEKKSLVKTSIVGQESGGWIVESYSLSESQESTSQMLITGLERVAASGNVDDLDIVWVKVKQKDGKIEMIEGPVLSITKGLYRKGLMGFNVKLNQTAEGGNVSVNAGTFAGTVKTRSEVSFLGSTYVSDNWYHSEVPINGLVKSVSDDGKYTMELLDFGTYGAEKTIRD